LISSTASWNPAEWALPYTVQAPLNGEMTPTLIGLLLLLVAVLADFGPQPESNGAPATAPAPNKPALKSARRLKDMW
jgi:hypothetical protein